MLETLIAHARSQGPLSPGCYRVAVLESDLRITVSDFTTFDEARTYANDAASEVEVNPPIAVVLDSDFKLVHEGRHYATDR